MNSTHAPEVFAQLPHEDKLNFLVGLAHELTIVGRDTYCLGGSGLDSPQRLRALNEIQHRILAFCLALMKDDPKRYPEDVLLNIILDHPEDSKLQGQVRSAFDRILSRHAPAA
jgi:hypothetical protein